MCAVAMALLTTSASGFGVIVLVVIPGFILGRIRGGTGVLGGTMSGCLIPMVLAVLGLLIEYFSAGLSLEQVRYELVGLYLGFLPLLFFSFVTAGVIHRLDRRLQGRQGPEPGMASGDSAGLRFPPDEDRPALHGGASRASVSGRAK